MPQQVIVVGGGLSGLSAAHSIIQRGGNVLVLDKNVFLGGNSTKATSGINGALTQTQIKKKIPDSWEIYARDTALGAGIKEGNPNPLMEVLCRESAPAIEWLQKYFNLDLSLVSQLGGHSFPRTHRGPEKFPGMTITYALMEKLEQIEKETNGKRGKVICGAKVTKLIYKNNEVVGVEYELDGKIKTAEGPVVLATGGFAADFGKDSILSKVRPDLLSLSTTNGEHCTGDGIKMAEEIGASTVDLEKVQVHPTGLVDPADPNAKVKFLAAEALRGVGALLLNGDGERFVNELGTRDYVSEVMQKNKGPFRLVLNGKAAKEIEWHCKHYVGRGLMKRFDGAGLAKDIGVSPSKLEQTFKKYNEACNKGVNGTPDEFGKKYFNNFPFDMNDTFHVAQVCPLLHYCMGGLQISPESAVVDKQGAPIAGLFACGEVAGGIHLKNRLGGSSLTDCVVFGRVAGDSAATYLLGKLMNSTGSPVSTTVSGSSTVEFTIKQQPIETTIQLNPQNNNIQLNVRWNQSGSAESTQATSVPVAVDNTASASSSTPAPAAAPAPEKKELKTYTLEDVAKHNKEGDIWVVVNGQVLDCTNFLKKHPGGAKAILLYAGKDATEEFNMLHDANVIEKYAPYTIIGTLAGAKAPAHGAESAPAAESKPATGDKGSVEYVTGDFLKPNNPLSLDACVLPTPSSTPSRNSGGTADILPAERKKATFEVEKMTNFIDGGEEATSKKRFIRAPLDGLDMSDMHNWDRSKLMAKHVEHFIGVHKKFSKYKPTRQEMAWMSDFYMLKGSLMNHHGLFLMTLTGMASDEQKQWWLQKALRFEITGCYAQTELGHGSNVRGLQTIATYDKTTQEFIVDTPTLTAMKWWPGTLGKVCTHALVYAQLILDGKEYGVHVFMVQVRDENHRPLPGIELGDLGAKLGDNANDTGFLRLNKVRIPREYMLSGLQSVTAEGQYVKSARKTNDKMHYATMMYTRGLMIAMGAGALAKAATIATRYSCVRRQGFEDPSTTAYNAKEVQIIDHQMQRYRVFRQIALVYTLKFTASWMLNKFAELEKGEVGVIQDTSALPEIAATSAGLKALSTIMVADAIEDLRKSCGGNGYLMSAGIAPIAADYVWQTTAEGDFIILMLQTARFLLKSIQSVRKGQKLTGPVEYLNVVAEPGFNLLAKAPAQPTSLQQLQNLSYLSELFRFRALSAVLAVSVEFAERTKKGESFNTAWNALAVEFCGAVKAHCLYFMLTQAINKLNECKEASIKSALEQVFVMFALSNILDDNWAGLLTAKQVQFAKQACFQVMNNMRPNCVALVDSFDLPDNVLNSTIGRYDGNVYEALYESALKSESNRKDPFEGYNEVLRPHLDLEFLKRGNKSKM